MAVFSNKAINRTYIHSALRAFADNAGGLFVLVFLLKMGVPAPLVFCSVGALTFLRYVLRPAVLPVAKRIGLRNLVIVGTLLEAAAFAVVPFVEGIGPALAAYVGVAALGQVAYFTGMHAYISALGDSEHRGKQVGAMHAVYAIAGVFAPVLGSFLLVTKGSFLAFYGAAMIQAAAGLSLIGAPDVPVAPNAQIDVTTARKAQKLFFAAGWSTAFSVFVWQIALFVTLGERFVAYGGAMALAGLVGAAMSLGLGRMIDLGHGQRSVRIAYGAYALGNLFKAVAFSFPLAAVTANAMGVLVSSMTMPILHSRVYNLAKRSPCTLRFHILSESGWDMGCTCGCLVAGAASTAGVPFSLLIPLAIVGAAVSFSLLRASFREDEASAPAEAHAPPESV